MCVYFIFVYTKKFGYIRRTPSEKAVYTRIMQKRRPKEGSSKRVLSRRERQHLESRLVHQKFVTQLGLQIKDMNEDQYGTDMVYEEKGDCINDHEKTQQTDTTKTGSMS